MNRTFIRYFDYSEFDCPYAQGSGYRHMDREFLVMLDEARYLCNFKFKVLRGYVSSMYKDRLIMLDDSPHLLGKAAVLHCKVPKLRLRMVAALLEVGFHRIGIGPDYIYVDNDEVKDPMLIVLSKDRTLKTPV